MSFGLINIPVKLYSATGDDRIDFDLLHEQDGGRIRYRRVCEKDGQEVDWDEIVKGYECSPGEYVTFTHDELDELDVDTMKMIDIDTFVRLDDIDPIYYEKTYYLAPQKGGEKAYRLLCEALDRQDRVGVAKFALRQKEHLSALRVMDGWLVVQTMHWPSEIREPDFDIDTSAKVRTQERDMAIELIDKLTGDFEPERYRNDFERKLKAAARRKAQGKQVVIAESTDEQRAPVDDLMAALTASISGAGKRRSGSESSKSHGNGNGAGRSREWLLDRPKRELSKLAREREIKGRSDMTKDELVDALTS